MSDHFDTGDAAAGFAKPHEYTVWEDIQGYLIGLVLAVLLTAASFYVVYTHLIWAPAIPIALVVLAVAQIGVHLVFFLHLTTAPDNTNNVLGTGPPASRSGRALSLAVRSRDSWAISTSA